LRVRATGAPGIPFLNQCKQNSVHLQNAWENEAKGRLKIKHLASAENRDFERSPRNGRAQALREPNRHLTEKPTHAFSGAEMRQTPPGRGLSCVCRTATLRRPSGKSLSEKGTPESTRKYAASSLCSITSRLSENSTRKRATRRSEAQSSRTFWRFYTQRPKKLSKFVTKKFFNERKYSWMKGIPARSI
jgi:hypothetical protein